MVGKLLSVERNVKFRSAAFYCRKAQIGADLPPSGLRRRAEYALAEHQIFLRRDDEQPPYQLVAPAAAERIKHRFQVEKGDLAVLCGGHVDGELLAADRVSLGERLTRRNSAEHNSLARA